jgi:squalene-associated FAD-dependent desaturase
VTTAIVGGGYAGMAAAVELADAGVPVTVFEAAQELGGRARRVVLDGMALDNGQHILLGAYRETLALISRVHPDPGGAMLRQPLEIVVAGEFRLKAAPLPAPLDLALGFAMASGLPFGERLAAAQFLLRLRRGGFKLERDLDVATLLREAGQGARTTRLLWEPLCVAALNTPIGKASAQVFVHVLQDGLLGAKGDSDIVIPRVDLTSLFPAPAAAFVTARGGQIHAGCTIRAVERCEGGYRLAGDLSPAVYSNVVVAASPHRLRPLIEGLLAAEAAAVDALDYQPISTCYLQYPGEVRLPAPMTGMAGGAETRLGQWAFDRQALSGISGLVAIVISAEGAHQGLDQDTLAERLHRELAGMVQGLPERKWHRVIAEKRATFACRPGLVRPAMLTTLPGLYLAGDYVASRYPATLEAAVRSGRAAARHILATRMTPAALDRRQ